MGLNNLSIAFKLSVQRDIVVLEACLSGDGVELDTVPQKKCARERAWK